MERTDYKDYVILCPCGSEAVIAEKRTPTAINYCVICPNCGRTGARCYSRSRAISFWNKSIPKETSKERCERQAQKYMAKQELKRRIHEYCAIIRRDTMCKDCPLNETPACVSDTVTLAQLKKAVKICKERYGDIEYEQQETI